MAAGSRDPAARLPGWLPLAALLLVTALAYARLAGVDFSWDDEALVVDNQLTGSLDNLGAFFTRDLWSTTRLPWLKSGYYRPLMLLSLALDRALFGLDSAEAHVHDILWHLAAVALLWALLRRLVEPGPALAGAALFALHPVQSEVLALVAARNDAMAAALALLALVLLVDRTAGWGRLLGGGAALLAALLCKESALLAPFMLLALDLARWRRPGAWPRYAALGLALAVYLGLRHHAGVDEAIAPAPGNLAVVARHALDIAGVYGRLVVWPWPLTPARHVHYLPPLHETLFGLVVFLGLVTWGLARGRHRALVVVGLVWALLSFLPSLAATVDKGLLGERYLYLPMAGLGIALAGALDRLPLRALAAFVLASVTVLQLRLPDWQDSRTVWERAHAVAPTPFTAGGLAWYLHRDGVDPDNPHAAEDLARSVDLMVEALAGDPPYRDVCDMIVSALLEAKQAERAVEVGRWALRERGCPRRGLILDHLAVALAGTGRWDEAEQVALAQPGGVRGPGLVVVAAARARRGDLDTARRLAAGMPEDPNFLARVAKLLRLGGEAELARRVAALPRESPAESAPPGAPGR